MAPVKAPVHSRSPRQFLPDFAFDSGGVLVRFVDRFRQELRRFECVVDASAGNGTAKPRSFSDKPQRTARNRIAFHEAGLKHGTGALKNSACLRGSGPKSATMKLESSVFARAVQPGSLRVINP